MMDAKHHMVKREAHDVKERYLIEALEEHYEIFIFSRQMCDKETHTEAKGNLLPVYLRQCFNFWNSRTYRQS